MEAAAVSSSRCRRPVMYTWAPSLASCLAVARPMPELPPVTRATLPSSFPGMVFLSCRCVCTGHTGQPGDTLACPQTASAWLADDSCQLPGLLHPSRRTQALSVTGAGPPPGHDDRAPLP